MKRIRALEAENKNLLKQMEELKRLIESKTAVLESEVIKLREELASSRTSIGLEDKVFEDPPTSKMKKPEKWKLKVNIVK